MRTYKYSKKNGKYFLLLPKTLEIKLPQSIVIFSFVL